MRYFYSLMLYLMLPWVMWRMWRRGARIPAYRRHWKERFGWLDGTSQGGLIWVHSVSVGEVRAAQPLIEALQRRRPHQAVLLSTTTPAGRETAQRLFGGGVPCVYLPWDLPGAVRRFLARVSPDVAIIMETEIWPNLYRALSARNILLLLVNARLSGASLRGYASLRGLACSTLRCVAHIAAQTEEDAQRFLELGAVPQQVTVAGNLKLDARPPADFAQRSARLRDRLGAARDIWIAGSTHAGEETLLLEAHRQVLTARPGALLILAPRHPERAPEVATMCERAGMDYRYFSAAQPLASNAPVLILDVIGELACLYGAADVAFIGGSLVDRGGHNPVEAVLADVAVVTGPSTANFSFIYQELTQRQALCCVDSSAELAAAVTALFADPQQRRTVAGAARRVVEQHRGALQRILALLDAVVPPQE